MNDTLPQGVLTPGYQILWYRIGRVLGRGAFGITYMAQDVNLDRTVAIKEFFPGQHCHRSGPFEVAPVSAEAADDFRWALDRFQSEARTLAQFEHPNIIRVLNVFEQNGTAYMVMQFESGLSLSKLLKRRRTLSQTELTSIVLPLLDGLEKVHARGFIHRDIKPANIYIREGGSPVLLDFGSARQSISDFTQTLTSLVSPGFAPIEQYTSKGDRQGPWTDIYGFGATLYRAVTGLVPPSAVDRSEAISTGSEDYMAPAGELAQQSYSAAFLAAIDHALGFRIDERPQSIHAWRQEFGFSEQELSTTINAGWPGLTDSESAHDIKTGSGTETIAATEIPTQQDAETVAMATHPDSNSRESTTELADSQPPADRLSATTNKFSSRPYLIAIAAAVIATLALVLISGKQEDPLPAETEQLAMASMDSMPTITEIADSITLGIEPFTATVIDSTVEEQTAALLAAAREDIDALRLTTPADANAYDKFQQVLELDPDNVEALQGLEAIFDRYMQLARRAAAQEDFDRAENMLERAAEVLPDSPKLMRAHVALEQKRTQARMQQLSDSITPTTDITPGNSADRQNSAIRRHFGFGR
ncbi:MAG: protein kinase [Gammaproteobacteria bacterium]